MATVWQAVVLLGKNEEMLSDTSNAFEILDEADVFLEQRTPSDLKRNAMVAVFLRQLE